MGHMAINVSANGHPPDLEAVPAVTPAYFLPEGSRRSHALQHNSADTCRSQHFHMQAHARHTRWQQAQRVQNCAHWAAAHLMNAGASVSSPRDLSNEPRGAPRGSGSLAQLTCTSRGVGCRRTVQSRAFNYGSISEMLSRPSGRGYHAPAIRMHPICPLINLAKTDFGQVSYNAHAHPLFAASIGPP